MALKSASPPFVPMAKVSSWAEIAASGTEPPVVKPHNTPRNRKHTHSPPLQTNNTAKMVNLLAYLDKDNPNQKTNQFNIQYPPLQPTAPGTEALVPISPKLESSVQKVEPLKQIEIQKVEPQKQELLKQIEIQKVEPQKVESQKQIVIQKVESQKVESQKIEIPKVESKISEIFANTVPVDYVFVRETLKSFVCMLCGNEAYCKAAASNTVPFELYRIILDKLNTFNCGQGKNTIVIIENMFKNIMMTEFEKFICETQLGIAKKLITDLQSMGLVPTNKLSQTFQELESSVVQTLIWLYNQNITDLSFEKIRNVYNDLTKPIVRSFLSH
jgi:hypothetical protein